MANTGQATALSSSFAVLTISKILVTPSKVAVATCISEDILCPRHARGRRNDHVD
jgi:hypothetical protein